MSQLLVAVKSCLADLDRGCHDVIRSTWGEDLKGKALLRFFVGKETDGKSSRVFKSDEIVLDVADDYHSLPFKTRGICQWATNKLLSGVFLCDNDTYVNVNRLLACGYQGYDYAGKISQPLGQTFPYEAVDRNGKKEIIDRCHPWASGGFGYFLSNDAVMEISEAYPTSWAEDLWVGQMLGPFIVKGQFTGLDLPANSYSWHFPSGQYGHGYNPADGWMELMHGVNQ